MYTTHFGFNEQPFVLTPNPRFMFLSDNHREAFAHLLYGINNHHGFMCLTGEVGTGKTTLLRALLGRLKDDRYRTALIFNPCLTDVELLQSINREFGVDSASDHAGELLNSLNHFLLSENSRGHTVVLVIDEAQNLQPAVLEQIRLISNLETESAKLVQILLVGQPELRKLLKKPELRQLDQRIAVRYTLKPMNQDETGAYIRHRIKVAGNEGGELFSNRAIGLIHLHSHGVPRMINIICDRALLNAYSHEQYQVTAWTVFKAIWELRELPVPGYSKEYRAAEAKRPDGGSGPERKPAAPGDERVAERRDTALVPDPGPCEPELPVIEIIEPEHFDLGEELRLELDDERPSGVVTDTARDLSMLYNVMSELNDPEPHGGILLLILGFAGEFFNRAVVFVVQDSIISGVGQFGINDDPISGDEKARTMVFPLESCAMFRVPFRTSRATILRAEHTADSRPFFEQLGGEIPDEAFIGPIVNRSRVIGFLYGDNLPDSGKIGGTEALEIFLSQAGAALEKIMK